MYIISISKYTYYNIRCMYTCNVTMVKGYLSVAKDIILQVWQNARHVETQKRQDSDASKELRKSHAFHLNKKARFRICMQSLHSLHSVYSASFQIPFRSHTWQWKIMHL